MKDDNDNRLGSGIIAILKLQKPILPESKVMYKFEICLFTCGPGDLSRGTVADLWGGGCGSSLPFPIQTGGR